MPDPHHPKSPMMEAVDREADRLASVYGGMVPGAALAAAMRNLMADHDRQIAELTTMITDLASAIVKREGGQQ